MTKVQYSDSEQLLALFLVILLASIGGVLVSLLSGYKQSKLLCIPAFEIKPLMTKVTIPPLLAQIILGTIARNFLGDRMKAYPAEWAQWIRNCILAIVITRGGMNVKFAGTGILVPVFIILPNIVEVTVSAFMAQNLFDMPIEVAYCLGYACTSIAASILVP